MNPQIRHAQRACEAAKARERHWKLRAERAEYALGPYLCPKCQKCLTPQELDHTMCRQCAEKDMAKRLGAGLLDLPSDWYDHTPDRGPQ